MTPTRNTVIESVGVYFPARTMSTREVLDGCRTTIRFPLERITGIKSRHVAGDTEFSIDLAKKAVAECLAKSTLTPDHVDLLICSNISRFDGPNFCVSYEPNTSVKLKKHFGFDNALAFDVGSACSGMFVAIQIVDAFIKAGMIRSGLVVSGEYISNLTRTAQLEIESNMDPRLACLTLGDAGAAVMLQEGPDDSVGFHEIDLCTLGRYSTHCLAGPTDKEHGGGIMVTKALQLTNVAVKYGSKHALRVLDHAGWAPESFQHLIMHQTSRTTLRSAMREINRLVKKRVCHWSNTIDNLADRGNTASTAHVVALMDSITSGTIGSGDRVVFAISGSGQTIGTALYTLDDLPDRLRQVDGDRTTKQPAVAAPAAAGKPHARKLRIAGWGSTMPNDHGGIDSLELLKCAATACLDRSSYHRNDIGLLIYAGVYRSEFITEPAIASLLAGELNINATGNSPGGKTTLAFDVFNGALGLLNACHLALPLIRATNATSAMVVTAEIENNAADFPESLLGVCEIGSALIVEEAAADGVGFGTFLFRSFTDHLNAFTSHVTNRDGKRFLDVVESPDIERHYISGIVETVDELLSLEGLDMSHIDRIFPPQKSASFISRVAAALHVPEDKCVDAVGAGRDLFTSSVPCAWQFAYDNDLVTAGDVGLIICVGSGIQVGCAIYYF